MISTRAGVSARLRGQLVLIALTAIGVVLLALLALGKLTLFEFAMVTLGPAALALVVWRPQLIILGLVALPPGVARELPFSGTGNLALLLTGAALLLFVMSGRFPSAPLGLIPLAIFIVVGLFFRAEVASLEDAVATQFLNDLTYYFVLGAFTYSLTKAGLLRAETVGAAMIIGVLGAAALFWAQGGSITPQQDGLSQPEVGGLFYDTHFGYFVAIGFGLALARALRAPPGEQPRLRFTMPLAVATAFLLVTTLFSYTRGAWAAAAVVAVIVFLVARKRVAWLLVPLLVVALFTAPAVQDVVLGDAEGTWGEIITSSEFTTGRSDLWAALATEAGDAFPFGHGFGYMWTLEPSDLLQSEVDFTTEQNPFVYAHNDFLYATVDLGFPGLALLVSLWIFLLSAVVRALRQRATQGGGAVLLLPVVVTMLLAELVDNGLFIRPVAERFFVATGVIFAAGAGSSARGTPKQEAGTP